ncbi:UbiA prenyltransferase family [Xylariaceae sp. FL0594]|nr:UbiA prenyltransferase family [Xylariaceae sp. FL0594]
MAAATGYRRPRSGVFGLMPDSWVPYAELMRLDRLSGFWAFYWPYLIGLGFAVNVEPFSAHVDWQTLAFLAAYLALWTTVFRGIVCTWNDNLDQDFDRQVARCRTRPIPRGAVTTSQAHLFTAAQTVVGIWILSRFQRTVLVHAFIDCLLLFIYPLLKRCTNFPQVELGFGLSYAIFIVTAILGKDPLAPLLDDSDSDSADLSTRLAALAASPLALSAGHLYLAGILWCVIFDTVYAHQDYEDDLRAGVRGLAVLLGRRGTKPALAPVAAAQVYCLVAAGQHGDFGTLYYAVSCGGAAVMLTSMIWTVRLHDAESCAWWFGQGSGCVGAAVTIGLLADFCVKRGQQ